MDGYYEVQHAESMFASDIKLFRFLKELLLKNYKIFEIYQKTGDLIPYHSHGHKEIIIIMQGQMRMIIEEDIIDLSEGDMITIQPWAVHLSCFPEKEGCTFYLCHPAKKYPYSRGY